MREEWNLFCAFLQLREQLAYESYGNKKHNGLYSAFYLGNIKYLYLWVRVYLFGKYVRVWANELYSRQIFNNYI